MREDTLAPKTGESGQSGRGFRGLVAWQRADQLASATYRRINQLPQEHRWLAVQAIRAAVSVPANIAEGYGRGSLGDYLRFLDIARGSLAELEYYLHFMESEQILTPQQARDLQELVNDTAKPLHGLWRSLKDKAREKGAWDRSGAVREEPVPYDFKGPALENGLPTEA